MFKRILVPLDGSASAERALPIAKRIAQASEGTIVLIGVVDTLALPQRVTSASVVQAAFAEASRYITSLVQADEPDTVPVETMVLGGSAASLILSVEDLAQTDLLILCRHGYADARRQSIGSVAEKVIWQSTRPVLVLGEVDPLPGLLTSRDAQPMRILVPLDGSAHAKTALLPAAQLISAISSPALGAMHLLHIVPAEIDDQEAAAQKARDYLEALTQALHEGLIAPAVSELHLAITWSVVAANDSATAIVQSVENGEQTGQEEREYGPCPPCEVIAIATHGWGGAKRWAMGGITERVLQATQRPLLIVHPSWGRPELKGGV